MTSSHGIKSAEPSTADSNQLSRLTLRPFLLVMTPALPSRGSSSNSIEVIQVSTGQGGTKVDWSFKEYRMVRSLKAPFTPGTRSKWPNNYLLRPGPILQVSYQPCDSETTPDDTGLPVAMALPIFLPARIKHLSILKWGQNNIFRQQGGANGDMECTWNSSSWVCFSVFSSGCFLLIPSHYGKWKYNMRYFLVCVDSMILFTFYHTYHRILQGEQSPLGRLVYIHNIY